MPDFQSALWARLMCRKVYLLHALRVSSVVLFSELQHRLPLQAHSALQLPRHAEYVEMLLLLRLDACAVILPRIAASSSSDSLLDLTHSIVQDAGRTSLCVKYGCQCQEGVRLVVCVQVQAMERRLQTRRQSCSPPSRS